MLHVEAASVAEFDGVDSWTRLWESRSGQYGVIGTTDFF
jgi:hypothetical protein